MINIYTFFFWLYKNVFYIGMNLRVSAEGINLARKNPELEGDFVPCMLLFAIMQSICRSSSNVESVKCKNQTKVKFLHMYLCSGLKNKIPKIPWDIVGTWDNGKGAGVG